MHSFKLDEPTSFEEALDILAADPDARPIAGGTALVVMMKQGILRLEHVVSLRRIKGASEITYRPTEGLRIAAMASVRTIERDARVQRQYPILAQACQVVGNVRIRNLATLGGNLAHADYQSDPPTALLLLNGRVVVRGRNSAREELIDQFLVDSYYTTLAPGELITHVIIPPQEDSYPTRYVKFTTRHSEDRPCIGIAIAASMDRGQCMGLRIAIGAVSPTPIRATAAEQLAIGETLTVEIADAIGRAAASEVEPISDVRGSADYKRHLVSVLTSRTLLELTDTGEE